MARVIDAGTEARSHVARCSGVESTTIESPTRVHHCGDNENETIESFVPPIHPTWVPMHRIVRSCVHAVSVTHRCPACGFERTFGGAA